MRYQLKRVKQLVSQLDAMGPKEGMRKWHPILSSLRVAGQPRSVSISEQLEILEGMLNDTAVPGEVRDKVKNAIATLKDSAAFAERVWLDQNVLQAYLKAFRENDYQSPWHQKWIENRTQVPYPYGKQQ